MKITAVTPPDAASDPAHPDHDRWVKETTLRMEVEHAKLAGLSLRHAEAENARLLARAEQRAKEQPQPIKRDAATARADRHAARGITRKAPAKAKTRRECSCGLCIPCRRKMRVLAIFSGKANPILHQLGKDLGAAFLAATVKIGAFKDLRKQDVTRAFNAKIDAICDRSVAALGAWR